MPVIEVLGNPLLFLRLLSEHSVPRTFAPKVFLYKLQKFLDAAPARDSEGIDLDRLLYITSAGEPNNVDIGARVGDHLIKLGVPNKNIMTPGFGMTETCAGAISNQNCPDNHEQAVGEFAALGTCVSSIEMRISPIYHAACEATVTNGSTGTMGALEIGGPVVFEKYFHNDEATRDTFTLDGWFKTDDLATIDATGNLKLLDRSEELVTINGVKYLPHEIESVIN